MAKQPRSAAAGADLISGLCDDVLVRILALLPDARGAVRTGALSRRWRGLWTRVPVLRFAADELEFDAPAAAERYVSFISTALASRASQAEAEPDIEHLAISVKLKDNQRQPVVPPLIDAAQGWMLYAVRHAVRSFDHELHLPKRDFLGNRRVLDLDELPGSAKLERLRLELRHAQVQLPATAVFSSLTDLSLERLDVEDGGGHLLARLLSPACCPRLQKLHLRELRVLGLEELLLDISTLSDLSSLEDIEPCILKLTAPNLRVLRIHDFFRELAISAPKLEELTLRWEPWQLDVVGSELSRVEILKVDLCPRANNSTKTKVASKSSVVARQPDSSRFIFLLPLREYEDIDVGNGRIPHLPHVKSLTVRVTLFAFHSFGASIANILAQCSNLEYLGLHFDHSATRKARYSESDFICYHTNHWKSHDVSLAHLPEVEFRGLAGTDCELWFMQFVISRAAHLRKVAISFSPKFNLEGNNRDGLKLKPLLGGGVWSARPACTCLSYEWRSCV